LKKWLKEHAVISILIAVAVALVILLVSSFLHLGNSSPVGKFFIGAVTAIQEPISLFEPVYHDGGDALYVMDQIKDEKNKDAKWLENLAIKEAMEKLGDRERKIIALRFFQGKTQVEVSEEIGISQAQVSRLEKSALKFMRKYI